MCEIAYLSIKNPKASRALKQALDPRRRMLASLRYVGSFRPQKLGPPPWPNPGSAPGITSYVIGFTLNSIDNKQNIGWDKGTRSLITEKLSCGIASKPWYSRKSPPIVWSSFKMFSVNSSNCLHKWKSVRYSIMHCGIMKHFHIWFCRELCWKHLSCVQTERKRMRKRKFSLMFAVYSLIFFTCSLIFFAFLAFAWCE